ncbi:MAG: hypothetical protein ABGX04_04970 [Myxococcales bacterium]
MLWAVHREGTGFEWKLRVGILNNDAPRGGIGGWILLDLDDVFEARDGPTGIELALRAIVDRLLFFGQSFEISPNCVGLKEFGVGIVDLLEWNRLGVGAGVPRMGGSARHRGR